MAKRKKKGSKSSVASLSIMGSLSIVLVIASVLMNTYSTVAGSIFGFGEMKITEVKAADDATGEYISYSTSNTDESIAYAQQINRDVMSEGATLVKNEENMLPLQSGTKVTLFGCRTRSMNMAGGENPAETEGASSLDVALTESGTFDVNPGYEQLPTGTSKVELTTDEYNAIYGSSLSEYGGSNGVAIVTLERNEGEGTDFSQDMGDAYNNCTELSIYPEELDMLSYVCSNFDNVIVLINSSNTMELGFVKDGGSYMDKYTGQTYDFSNIKSCLWVGGVGSTGCYAINDILCGAVNPSGHLVDTYVRDTLATPAAVNAGNYEYSNSGTGNGQDSYNKVDTFVQYEEGIYVGYRYFETAYAEAEAGNYERFDYEKEVIYPFGYGLSYTDFSMKYASEPVFDENTNTYKFEVEVTNEGDVAGKGVAQIYAHQPYNAGSGIEKAEVVLAGYGKTQILEPGSSEVLNIQVNRDDICSYDYKGAGSYVLDEGDYNFYLSENSHSWASIDKSDTDLCWTWTLDNKVEYSGDNNRPSDKVTATNVFDDTMNYMFTDTAEDGKALNMSRDDFAGTFPTEPTAADCIADEQTLKDLSHYIAKEETEDLTVTDMPVTDSTSTAYQLVDMRGVDFDDPSWDDYLDQFSTSSLYKMFSDGAWVEHADEAQGVPETIDMDGPYGFFGHSFTLYGNVWYCSEPVLAATFNTELAEQVGDAFAEEAHNQKTPLTGWYGPGCNTHRNAFGGRNYEYYSEDPVLAGTMCSAEVSGASEKGLIAFTKHFALNDQETNRKGICTWANEQAAREIYFHSYEIYVKNAKMDVNYYTTDSDGNLVMETKEMSAATGVMTGYNRIGSVNCCHSTEAVVDILKGEWGFTGTAITDCGGGAGTEDYMDCDHALRSGAADLMLSTCTAVDHTSATAIHMMKQACKRILFNKANSNALQGIVKGSTISYTMAPWQVGLGVAWAVIGIMDVAVVALAVMKRRKTAARTASDSDEN